MNLTQRNASTTTIPAFALAIGILCSPAPTLAVESGLQPGDTASAFYVDDITGPRQGNTLCYACAFGPHRVVNIQTTKITDGLVQLIKRLDGMVDPASEIRANTVHAFVVYLTEDPDAAAEELQAIADQQSIKNIPLTVYDDPEGAPPYKLSTDAEVTVMMWNETKVVTNHAFAPGELGADAIDVVLQDADHHLAQ